MQRIILAGAALAALALVQSPAVAQYVAPTGQGTYGHNYDYGHADQDDQVGRWDLDARIGWVQDRIDRGLEGGELERDAAERAQVRLRYVRLDEARARDRHRGRLPDLDRARLMARVDQISNDLRWRGDEDDYRRPWEDR
jgi:hypothetical protein